MATTKLAFRSILDTVTKTAGSLNSVLDASVKTIGMADAFVTKASEQQALRYKADKRNFVHNLVRDAAMEKAEADKSVDDYCKQSDDHARFFNDAHNEFEALFADELGLEKSRNTTPVNLAA